MNKLFRGVLIVLIITLVLLSIPLIAMQFTDEVVWTLIDFVVMGLLLFLLGISYVLIVLKVKNVRNRIIIGILVLVVFLLIWLELAVGIFGSPFAGS